MTPTLRYRKFADSLPEEARFEPPNDPKFADKLKEVVGLYVDPPAHAVVLSIDEKSLLPLSAS